ncbi:hypothetical protein V8F33_010128 [Rhypophila sp. PSN 637]
MSFSLSTTLFTLLGVAAAASLTPPHGASHLTRATAKSIPAFPFDSDTAKVCVWWFDNEDVTPAWSCEEIEILHGVSLWDFVYWNPSLSLESCHMKANQSYCLSALSDQPLGPAPEPATVTVISTSILEAPAPPPVTSPTKPIGNGVSTPSPTQNGLTTNCKTFYFVKEGDTCENIASRFGITIDKFISWNQGAKKDCTTLWAGTWACVGVL